MVSLNGCFDGIHLLTAGALSDEVSYVGSHVKPGDARVTRCAVVHCFYFIVDVVSKYFITMEIA